MDLILLAAGQSKRMGTNKLLLPFGKGSILSTALDSIVGANFSRVVVVTSAEIADLFCNYSRFVEFIINQRPEVGQSSSLKLGIEALGRNKSSFGIMLGDMPMISTPLLNELKEIFDTRPHGKTAVVPMSNDRFGHPSFYEPMWKERLLSIQGDRGGNEVIRKYKEEVFFIYGKEPCFLDVDRPSDYFALLK